MPNPPLTTRDVATLLWLTPSELARIHRVPVATILADIESGRIPAREYGDGYRIHIDVVGRMGKGMAA